jgi:predicted nucleic acid-binding protein
VIVVDTNVIVGLVLPAEWETASRRLFAEEPDWAAPLLWRSEFRNVLATQVRAGRLDLDRAVVAAQTAESVVVGREFSVDSSSVLRLAAESACTAYDCEFVALALHLGVRLFTNDRRLARAFPRTATVLTKSPRDPV